MGESLGAGVGEPSLISLGVRVGEGDSLGTGVGEPPLTSLGVGVGDVSGMEGVGVGLVSFVQLQPHVHVILLTVSKGKPSK